MSRQAQQAQFSNDAASLLRILKKSITAFDAILSNQQFNADSSSIICKISDQSKYLLQIIKRQKSKNHQALTKQDASLFRCMEKMKMRMKEWIVQNRNKYVLGYQFKQIRSFLQQIEIAFGIYQKNQEFITLITKTYAIIADQLRVFKIKYDLFHHKNPLYVESQHPKVRKTKSLILNQNMTIYPQPINLSAIYGIEIDYAHLKNATVLCKRNQLQFMQNQLERNKDISNQIDSYTKEYYLQKNRLKIKRKHFSQLYSRDIKSSFKNLRVKTTVTDKLLHNFQKEMKKCSSKQNREEMSSKKLVYQINNVYVSGNEFDAYTDHTNNPLCHNRPKRKGPAFLTRAIRDPLANRINQFNTRQLVN